MKPYFLVSSKRRAALARAAVGALALGLWAPLAWAQEGLIVPDEAALGLGVQASAIETAQQRAERADAERAARDREQWRTYRQITGGGDEASKAAALIAQYQGWIETHPDLHPSVVAEAGIVVSRLQRGSGDGAGATATLEALWETTKTSDGALSVRAEQAKLIMEGAGDKAGAGARAQALLEPLVERALTGLGKVGGDRFVPANALLYQLSEALKAQSKGAEMAQMARRALLQNPAALAGTLANANGWLYGQTIEALIGDARPGARGEALRWAKLHWVERSYETRGVSDGARWVAQALLAQPGGNELLAQWAKAQKDPALPNPLQKVELPATEPGALAGALDKLGPEANQRQARVSLLLWMGRERAAMEAALEGADKLPQNATGERTQVMREVARVFKARDLNIKGANAYLSWAAKPEGTNPLDAFFDATPTNQANATMVKGEATP